MDLNSKSSLGLARCEVLVAGMMSLVLSSDFIRLKREHLLSYPLISPCVLWHAGVCVHIVNTDVKENSVYSWCGST